VLVNPQSEVERNAQPCLLGKVALIAGAGRGIGEAIAYQFATEGATLIIASRTASGLERVAARVRQLGRTAYPIVADVADQVQVQHLVDRTFHECGRIDILINAAGTYGPIGVSWEVEPSEWKAAIEVNLYGTYLMCRAVIPHMIRSRSGKIINFSGGGATAPLPRFSAYGASKAAVVRLTETLAEELREFNIQVNAIAPGAVDTKLQDAVIQAGERAGGLAERMRQMRDSGVGATPIDVPARLAVFLASSSQITGRLISAPHDGWQHWSPERIAQLMAKPWLTLRRLDPFTIKPMTEDLGITTAAEEK
jgi:3-oxoacyl-[acyl-carrier protein] reductase